MAEKELMQFAKLSTQDVLDAILSSTRIDREKTGKGEVIYVSNPAFSCNHSIPSIPPNYCPHKIVLSTEANMIGIWRICDASMVLPSFFITNIFTGEERIKVVENKDNWTLEEEKAANDKRAPADKVDPGRIAPADMQKAMEKAAKKKLQEQVKEEAKPKEEVKPEVKPEPIPASGDTFE